MANTTSPNMGLTIPGIGTESGPNWASDINASLAVIDQHNHSSGQGVQIQPNGININADLPFNSNNATVLRTTRFISQSSVLNLSTDIGCLYVVGNELYYNDVTGGHNVQITSNGTVNATSSGIASGSATAAFSAGVLLVKSSSSSFANVDVQSIVLANSGNLSNQLTLQAPTLSSSYSITLPALPGSTSFMQMDSSGNMSASVAVSGGITSSNIAAGTITGSNIAAGTITGSKIAAGTITGSNIAAQTITQGLLAIRATGSTVAAGGVANSGNFSGSTTSSSNTPISASNVTITTTGRPVMVVLQSTSAAGGTCTVIPSTGGSNAVGSVFVYNSTNSTRVGSYSFQAYGSNVSLNTNPTLVAIDFPAAGTYTYQVQLAAFATGAGCQLFATNLSLLAFEL